MADEDAALVALIDSELDEDSRRRLLARLDEDEGLRARCEALRNTRAPITEAFDALLARSPVERLQARLPKEPVRERGWGFFRATAVRQLAAGFVAGLLVAGAAALVAFNLAAEDADDWRSAVVDYMQLYTNDTFAMPEPDPQAQAGELQAVGEKVGAFLTPERLSLPDLSFKVAFLLSYEGSPLGEIAFTDSTGAPVLVCVIANNSPSAPVRAEKRGDFSLASWSRGGRGYLVIGRLPLERAEDLARTLSERI